VSNSLIPPIFIGNFRSGTTLLANLLGFHEEIAPWFETKAFCEALRWQRVLQNPAVSDVESKLVKPDIILGFDAQAVAKRMKEDFGMTSARIAGAAASGKAGHESYPIGNDYVLYSLNDAEHAVEAWLSDVSGLTDVVSISEATGAMIRRLGSLHANLAGKSFWVNKTPEIPRFGRELRHSVGRSKIILMVRDGRDVVRSAQRLGWANEEEIAAWWKGMITESRAASREIPEDYLEVSYERLISDPVAELNAIFEFIGVAGSGEAIVDQYNRKIPCGHRLGVLDVHDFMGNESAMHPVYEGLVDGELLRSLGYLQG
jgi:hypothetical protein